jgi:drug/metabolite transporter (DMT)-like permease
MTHLIALTGILTISFSAILVSLSGVSPNTVAFYRCAYALPVLAGAWWLFRRRDHRRGRERWMAMGAGLLFALDLVFWHRAIEDIGAGMSTVLGNTQILFVGVLAWLFFRERPTRAALVMVPVAFLGVVLSSGLGRADAFGDNPVGGAIWGLLTGLSYAGFLLVFRASNRGLAPPGGPLFDATLGAAIGILLTAPFDGRFDLTPSWPAHGWLLLLAVGIQGIGWLLISVALPRLPSLETSVMLLLQPMAALLWGFLIFAEMPSPVQWAGVILVLMAVAVLSVTGSVEGAGKRDDAPEPLPPEDVAAPGPPRG